MFRRICAALAPGGVFVIDAMMAADPPSESAALMSALLWSYSGGAAHSFETYRGLLAQVGFRRATQLSAKWLMAVK